MPLSGLAVAEVGVGGILLYSGIKGYSIADTFTWLAKGTAPQQTEQIAQADYSAADIAAATASASGESGGTNNGNAQNQVIGRLLATPYGWAAGQEWDDLVQLWHRESGWSNTAVNPQSGAYGIAQALPYTKMPRAAWPPSDGGSASASAQISWGLAYIRDRYGDPVQAWAHEQSAGWY